MSQFQGFRFTDSVQGVVSIAPNKKELFKIQDNVGQALVVKIPMTHSGLVTRNKGFYLPTKMKDGSQSFVTPFPKPILRGHDQKNPFGDQKEAEPIGRIKSVKYIDTTEDLCKTDKKFAELYQAHLTSHDEASDLALAKHIIKKTASKGGRAKAYSTGTGYLEGVLAITDPDAIQKVLDGRYMTVSVSASSTSAFCSVCDQNLVDKGPCEHQRGEVYDGMPCVIIPGNLFYEHLAVVNNPADPLAAKFELFKENNDAFELVEANVQLADALEVATNAFWYLNDSKIEALGPEKELNIVTLADEITCVVNAMKTPDETVVGDATVTEEDKKKKQSGIGSKTPPPGVEPAGNDKDEDEDKDDEETKAKKKAKREKKAADAKKAKEDSDEPPIKKGTPTEEEKKEKRFKNKKDKKHADSIVDLIHSFNDGISESDLTTLIDKYLPLLEQDHVAHKDFGKNSDIIFTDDSKPDSKDISSQLDKGLEIETEHTQTITNLIKELKPDATAEEIQKRLSITIRSIAMDHLKEFPDYYTRLVELENEAKEEDTDDSVNINDSAELPGDLSWDELIAEDSYKFFEKELTEDEKLSTEKRNALKKGAFCGPNRSFPVPNCAHVTAARRLIGRAKVSESTKSRILACVSRKAKSLGCGESKDAVENQTLDKECPTCQNNEKNQGVMDNETILNKLREFTDLAKAKGLITEDCSACKTKDQELQVLEAQYDGLVEEIDVLVVENDEIKGKYKKQLADRVVDMKILSGDEIADRKVALAQYEERSINSLEDSFKDLQEKVDFSKVSAKINDGISREPQGKVTNPVFSAIDAEGGTPKKENQHKELYDVYDKLCKTYGQRFADEFIANKRSKGELA